MTLSQWLHRNRSSITAAAFARLLGVHHSTVHRWCVGTNVPRPAQMRAIRKATRGEVGPSDFYASTAPARDAA
jgi:DNA-binding transcriptional regulator YdaS (Cro superfamily)